MERDYIKLESTANAETVFSIYDKMREELSIIITNKLASGQHPFEIKIGPNGDVLKTCTHEDIRRLVEYKGFEKRWDTDTKRIQIIICTFDYDAIDTQNPWIGGIIKIVPHSYVVPCCGIGRWWTRY